WPRAAARRGSPLRRGPNRADPAAARSVGAPRCREHARPRAGPRRCVSRPLRCRLVTFAERWAELVIGPFRSSWRAGLGWTIAFVLLVVSTVAFWPAFRGSTALNEAFKTLPQGMIQAFGLQVFASAAGYLRGRLGGGWPFREPWPRRPSSCR